MSPLSSHRIMRLLLNPETSRLIEYDDKSTVSEYSKFYGCGFDLEAGVTDTTCSKRKELVVVDI